MKRSSWYGVGLLVAGMLSLTAATLSAEPLHLVLPTSNEALYYDEPSFYQYTDRYFQGERSRPWQGGRYGFVRNPRETAHGLVYTRFHEGVDIRPVYRDAAGEPLDTVRAVDNGRVVYVNPVASRSSYGKYIVVEHWWSGAPFYSLYAHLDAVHVRMGEEVRRGERIGRMGYTGPGLNRRRAHLHFEINMLLHQHFQQWYDAHYRGANRHDIFNGINMAGLDVPALYLALRADPDLSIEAFFARQESFFSVLVPNSGVLDLAYRYPWLASLTGAGYTDVRQAASWEVAFTRSGLPVRIRPTGRYVDEPVVSAVQPSEIPYTFLTDGAISGSGADVALTGSGRRYLALLTLPSGQTHLPSAWYETARLEKPAPAPVVPVRQGETLSGEEALRRLQEIRRMREEIRDLREKQRQEKPQTQAAAAPRRW